MLISLITTLHDRYTPVLEYRRRTSPTGPAVEGIAPGVTQIIERRPVRSSSDSSAKHVRNLRSGHSSKYGHLHLLQGGDRSPL